MNAFTVADQTKNLFFAMGLGFVIGIIYDIFRIIRLSVSRGKRAVFVQDILFFLLFAGMTFIFCLSANSGEVRFYIVFAEVLGFFIYYFSFGAFVIRLSDRIIGAIRKFFAFVVKLVSIPVALVFRVFSTVFRKCGKFTKKNSKKFGKKIKFLLRRDRSLLYNTFGALSSKKKPRNERDAFDGQ